LAKENKIDLTEIVGTGPKGRIVEADILKLLQSSGGPSKDLLNFRLEKLSKTKIITGERMSKSFQSAPHFYLHKDIEMSSAEELKDKLNASNTTKITYTDLIIKALSSSLETHPLLNAEWSPGGIKVFEDINIGCAISSKTGLVVVVIRHCNKKSITEIADERNALIQRANNHKLETIDVSLGTFTLTNLGMYAIDSFSPILNPPQAGILATGAITEKPVVNNSEIFPQLMMSITLAADHRVVDGAQGAEFLLTFDEVINKTG